MPRHRRMRVARQFEGKLESRLEALLSEKTTLTSVNSAITPTACFMQNKSPSSGTSPVFIRSYGGRVWPPSPGHGPQLHECEPLPNLEGLGLNYKGVQFQAQLETKQERPND